MRSLPALASVLMLVTAVSAQPIQSDVQTPEPEPEPSYHVEVLLFAWVDGDRAEEDFFHGQDNPRDEPWPKLLAMPQIELESVYDLDPVRSLGERESPSIEAPPATGTRAPEQIPQADGSLPSDRLLAPADAGTLAPGDSGTLAADRLELIEPEAGASADTFALASGASAGFPRGFRLLSSAELELGDVRTRLNRRPYRLLGHVGWAQTGTPDEEAVAIDLDRLGIGNPQGTIEVYTDRYHHVIVDLDFLDGQGTFWRRAQVPGLATFEYAKRYHHHFETDGFRSGEYRWIDHPLFGILVRITPAPEPEDQPGSDGTRPVG